MSILSVQEISKSYKMRKVVRSLSLEIKSGEVVGIAGLMGAGRTELARVVREHVDARARVLAGQTFVRVISDIRSILAAWNTRMAQEARLTG